MTVSMQAPSVDETEELPEIVSAAADATNVIKTGVIAAMGAGLVPLPGVDMAAIVAIQLGMVQQLGQVYGVALKENVVKASIMSLLGGVLPVTLAGGLVSAIKVLPGFGTLAGAAGVSILGGGLTYAVGRVFQQHLESNGALLAFDVTKARATFRRELESGLKMARSLRRKVTASTKETVSPTVAAPATAGFAAEPMVG